MIQVERPSRLTNMTSAFSQDFVQADRLIRRRYVQIPGAQKHLLERSDAWSESLSQGPHGMANVPPEVLQNVKDFYARKHSRPPSQQPSLARPHSAGSSAPPKLIKSEPPSSPRASQEDQVGDNWGTQMSWSPSPPRPPPGDRLVQPTQQPELTSSLRDQLPSQPDLLKRKYPHISLGGGTPSSSAQSDTVPYEPLSALGGKPQPPVNRGANPVAATQSTLPAATPPSAQAEAVLTTLSNTRQAESITVRPFNKRRRVEEMEPSDKEYETTGQKEPPLEFEPRPQPMETHDGSNTSSASASMPSFPSQAAVLQHQPGGALQAASAGGPHEQSSSNCTPTYEGRPRDTPTQQKNILRHMGSGWSMPPAPAQPSAEPAHLDVVISPQSNSEDTVPHRTPYEDFRAAYPDYEESTRAFIRACLAVKRLESERALPEFLYDDFVRANSTLYLDYYEEAQRRKYKEVLKPIHWYNENVKDIVYAKKIIRRDNLSAILNAHSIAVRQVRESILADSEPPESTDEANLKHDGDEHVANDGDLGREEHLGPEDSDISEPRCSPEFHVSSPGPVAAIAPAVVGDHDPKETDGPTTIVPASSRKRQYTETVEEAHSDSSPPEDIVVSEGSHMFRTHSTFNPQEPETVQDRGAPLREATPGIAGTPPSRKSPNQSQSRRDAATTAGSALKLGSSQRKFLATLQSSSPSSVTASVNRSANDKATYAPSKRAARQNSPAFLSQAESSEDESESFDPPVKKAALPPSKPANNDEPAFMTQAEAVYEIPDTPDRPSEEPMPPAPRQSVARSPVASQARPVQEQAASALKHDGAGRGRIHKNESTSSRTSIGPSIGARRSPASSNRSRASLDLFKPRVGETKEQRSKRNVEHFKKFLSKKTPGSTPGTTK
ncbi:hypothetical protein KVR01_007031 [Diaporthe batatas]|uniref:uncharacterized protein n=1 Tax=Diaporthe batatas TaxID=748121 RepID=UPI001D040D2A|nr:uncharacterized protein KVR01_007031 [Diaporthe batatas]KAG8163734.1 hypothetical protein KVR01_007031 [Diaporthe batatas]